MSTTMLITMLVCFAFSVSVAVSIGLAASIGLIITDPGLLILVPKEMFSALDKFPLAAIPFFILAGNLMETGGISQRLVDFARSIVGGIQGGLPMTCVLTCMIFAAVSGSSVATTFAIGAILIPALIRQGYPVSYAAALQATSAELGVVIPPSIPMILFGVAAEVSIGELFIAGVLPGIFIGGSLMLFVHVYCRIKGWGKNDGVDRGSVLGATAKAGWALLMPVIILGGIYGGIFTPTEAAAVAVFYALLVGMFLHRELKPVDLPRILRKSVISSGVIMFIIANAGVFAYMITPPFGVNLFAACAVARISLDKIIKHLIAFVLVIVGCLAVITYVPSMSLFLRDAVYRAAPGPGDVVPGAAPLGAPSVGPSGAGSPGVGPSGVGPSGIGPSPVGPSPVGPSPEGSADIGPSPEGAPTIGPSPEGDPTIGPSPVGPSPAPDSKPGN